MKHIKTILIIFVFCLLIFSPLKSYAFLGLFGDSHVDMVKDGVLKFDSSTTVAKALEGNSFLTNYAWESFDTKQGRKIVQFKANIQLGALEGSYTNTSDKAISYAFYNTVEQGITTFDNVFVTIQFVVNKNDTFEVGHVGLEKDGEQVKIYGKQLEILYVLYRNKFPQAYVGALMNIMKEYTIDNILASENIVDTYHVLGLKNAYFRGRNIDTGVLYTRVNMEGLIFSIKSISANDIQFDTVFPAYPIQSKSDTSPSIITLKDVVKTFTKKHLLVDKDNNARVILETINSNYNMDGDFIETFELIIEVHKKSSGEGSFPPMITLKTHNIKVQNVYYGGGHKHYFSTKKVAEKEIP